MPTIQDIRNDVAASELRHAAQLLDSRAAKPYLALAMVLDGVSRDDVAVRLRAPISGIYRWICQFNESGLSAIFTLDRLGRPSQVAVRDDISTNHLRKVAKASDSKMSVQLITMAKLLDGLSYAEVAKHAGVAISTIYYWVHRYNAKGVEGFQQKQRVGRQPKIQLRRDIPEFELRAAAESADKDAATRLSTIANLLDGMRRIDAARQANVTSSAICYWIRRFNDGGVVGLSSGHRRKSGRSNITLRNDVSADDLRDAAKRARRGAAKRLLTIANMLDGMRRVDAARQAEAHTGSLDNWRRRYNAEGIAGLLTSRKKSQPL